VQLPLVILELTYLLLGSITLSRLQQDVCSKLATVGNVIIGKITLAPTPHTAEVLHKNGWLVNLPVRVNHDRVRALSNTLNRTLVPAVIRFLTFNYTGQRVELLTAAPEFSVKEQVVWQVFSHHEGAQIGLKYRDHSPVAARLLSCLTSLSMLAKGNAPTGKPLVSGNQIARIPSSFSLAYQFASE
jgi:hypothetical protein